MDGPSSPTVPKTKGDFAVPPIRIGAGGHRPQCASQPALIRPIQHARGTAEGGGGGGRLRDSDKHVLDRFFVQNIPCWLAKCGSGSPQASDLCACRGPTAIRGRARHHRSRRPSAPMHSRNPECRDLSGAASGIAIHSIGHRESVPRAALPATSSRAAICARVERQHRCAHLDSLRPTLLGVICIWHIFKRLWAAAPSTAFGGPPPPRFARRRNLRRAR